MDWPQCIPSVHGYLCRASKSPKEFTPASSRAPSRAASSVSMAPSLASSRVSLVPSSRASSPVSYAASDMPFSQPNSPVSNRGSQISSRPSRSMSVIEIHDSDSDNIGSPGGPDAQSKPSVFAVENPPAFALSYCIPTDSVPPTATNRGKGKATKSHASGQIVITRQLKVDVIIHCTSVPPTFDVPRSPAAILLDLSGSAHLLVEPDGKIIPIDRFVRGEASHTMKIRLLTYIPPARTRSPGMD